MGALLDGALVVVPCACSGLVITFRGRRRGEPRALAVESAGDRSRSEVKHSMRRCRGWHKDVGGGRPGRAVKNVAGASRDLWTVTFFNRRNRQNHEGHNRIDRILMIICLKS